jgi:hypothetical protein
VFLGELGKECRAIAYAFGFFHLAQFRTAAALNWMEPLVTESLHELLRVRWLLEAIDVKPPSS